MEKLFTDKEYSEKAIEANSQGKILYVYTHPVNYSEEVLEWDITEVQVVDEEGNPVYDEEGNPVIKTIVTPRMTTEEIERQVVDEEGNPVYDEEGNPVMETVTIEVQAHHTEIKEKEVGELLIEDECYYVCYQDNYTDGTLNENYLADKQRRIDNLILTPSDVERALYYSDLHMNFDDLTAYIGQLAPQIDLKGLGIEFRANNFYRGAVDKNGNRLVDMLGQLLGYTPADMNYLFQHKVLPPKETPEQN